MQVSQKDSMCRSGLLSIHGLKFLQCSTKNPCDMCPKKTTSKWGLLKCRRGDFQCEAPLDKLLEWFIRLEVSDYENAEVDRATISTSTYNIVTAQRDEWVRSSGGFESFEEQTRTHGQSLQMLQYENEISGSAILPASDTMGMDEIGVLDANMQELEVPSIVTLHRMFHVELHTALSTVPKQPSLAALTPLTECILAIFWELLNCSSSRPILAERDEYAGLACLLSKAAVYQANFEDVRFISSLQPQLVISPCKIISFSLASKYTENNYFEYTRVLLTRS